MREVLPVACASFLGAASCSASVYNLQLDWSDTSNPNGPWTLREGNNPLPHVSNWTLAPWGTPQPGWARSPNPGTGLPFFFKSNGTEALGAHDWVGGQVVVHSTDTSNGVGSGPANVLFTVPEPGTLTVGGGVWIGREIGRGVNWTLLLNGAALTSGSVSSGDPYSSASPFAFSAGSGGAAAVTGLHVSANDQLMLRFDSQITSAGDFVVINLSVSINPACYPNCDQSTAPPILNVNDFSCFLNAFASGSAYANCDNSTAVPVLNVNDFACFLNQFAAGCP